MKDSKKSYAQEENASSADSHSNAKSPIKKLIINSPYEQPGQHWSYIRESHTFVLKEGRRSAGYIVASEKSQSYDDPGVFVELPVVNLIRSRVKLWRESDYPGATEITRLLLHHWHDEEQRDLRFFFCQLEAIETLIWLVESPDSGKSGRAGVEIQSDGGPFPRFCSKMATGSGKTIVMAMLIAWQAINKATHPQDPRFSKNFLVVAPGLTVKSRLQVLIPSLPGNYYEQFYIVPDSLLERLRQARVLIRNWQSLGWETEEEVARRRSVDKRGPKSNAAYVRQVLGDMARASSIVVINDEAHHAWRVPLQSMAKGQKKEEIDEATRWVGGLDRIHQARGILSCYDFTATPFAPSGKKTTEEALFPWIVSDFGLNDAIESGLVKTPRVVIRSDGVPGAADYKPKLYHIFEHVRDDLSRKASQEEPLPPLVTNAYLLLGKDWLEWSRRWAAEGSNTSPVMITVANRTETAARIEYAFLHRKILIDELCDPDRILHIDSKVLEQAESREEAGDEAVEAAGSGEPIPAKGRGSSNSKKDAAELLRSMVDTVGKPGKPGERIQNVISVGMLSEGWDVKTVTHIMGLRAFSSQLLCEQVVGRGLRRTSYEINKSTGLFDPEYVNIFGVPFSFLPHESTEDGPKPGPQGIKDSVYPDPAKRQFEISWPNIIRIDRSLRPELKLDLDRLKEPLVLNARDVEIRAIMAQILDGKTDISDLSEIDLMEIGRKFRMQKIIFEAASSVYDQMKATWKGSKEALLSQLIALVEKFITSDRLRVQPDCVDRDDLRRRIIITICISWIIQQIKDEIEFENAESIIPIFDSQHPIRSTAEMRTWFTGRPNAITGKSHVNRCVFDSTWEASEAFELDSNEKVFAWVKNDHLGYEIPYIFQGAVRKYRPDFIIKLKNGASLVLEVKGQESQQDKAKRRALAEWVAAVNGHGGFGSWNWAVSRDPADISGIIERQCR